MDKLYVYIDITTEVTLLWVTIIHEDTHTKTYTHTCYEILHLYKVGYTKIIEYLTTTRLDNVQYNSIYTSMHYKNVDIIQYNVQRDVM